MSAVDLAAVPSRNPQAAKDRPCASCAAEDLQAGETAGWIPQRRRLRVRTATSSPWLAPTRTGVRRLTAALRGRVLAASTSRGGPNAKRASGTDILTLADCCSGQPMSRNGSGRSRRGSWARLLWANPSRSGQPWDPRHPPRPTNAARSRNIDHIAVAPTGVYVIDARLTPEPSESRSRCLGLRSSGSPARTAPS